MQRRTAHALGVMAGDRDRVIVGMLAHHERPAEYWLQLVLSMGIATLGLVLDSTGVVIGAMLISPLMTPIVGLGMGLAIGSSVLTIRSFSRGVLSISAVVAGAAAITMALPFQEITREIAARTAPTLLDLLVAVFCALAAAFTTLRTGSDTMSTAAGTAIGIALVPPLCVVGFGMGTAQWEVASGAALLFTSNFSAILLFAVLSFLLTGFTDVNVHSLEEQHLGGMRPTHAIARWTHAALGSKYGPVLRIAMPAVLVAAVYVPLRNALSEVTWHVRARAEVMSLLRELPGAQDAVRSLVSVERHTIRVRLVILGAPEKAAKLKDDLTARIQKASGVMPFVEVTAVPDQAALREAAETAQQQRAPVPVEPVPDLRLVQSALGDVLSSRWPAEQGGPLLRWSVAFTGSGELTLECVHLGPAIGPAAEQMLSADVSAAVGTALRVREEAVPSEPVFAELSRPGPWLAALSRSIESTRQLPSVRLCITAPAAGRVAAKNAGSGETEGERLRPVVEAVLEAAGAGNWELGGGE